MRLCDHHWTALGASGAFRPRLTQLKDALLNDSASLSPTQTVAQRCLVPESASLRAFRAVLFIAAGLSVTQVATAQSAHWVGTWASAPAAVPNTRNDYAQDTTFREIV